MMGLAGCELSPGSICEEGRKNKTNTKQKTPNHDKEATLSSQSGRGLGEARRSEMVADPGGGADVGKLQVEPQEAVQFWGRLGFLLHPQDDVLWVGGKLQGGFPGAENVELLFVFQEANVWISCKRIKKKNIY